ncbi:MAG TPA: hypothetical protein VG389_01520 [Myxococcota bacterium]|nr:hypothetical protein [Myxococcota bacterium]
MARSFESGDAEDVAAPPSGADADSGPIVDGVGAAATAFAIAAARAVGDGFLAARLAATGSLVGAVASADPELRAPSATVLAEVVLLVGRRTRSLVP